MSSKPLVTLVLTFSAQASLFIAQILSANRINSVALKALSYHTAVEGIHTADRILTALLRTKAPNSQFSYGYARTPVLFEFSACAVITMMCASVSCEALLRLNFTSVFSDIVVNSQDVALPSKPEIQNVAVTTLIFAVLNALLICVVNKKSLRPPKELGSFPITRPYFSLLIVGKEFKVHISLVAQLWVLLSSWLVSTTGWGALDSIGALGCVAFVAPILDGLVRKTAPILLQSAPAAPRAAFDRGCREVATFEGVVECVNEHFWVNASGLDMGSITVRVRPSCDTQEMLAKVRTRLCGAVGELTVQVEVAKAASSIGS